MAKHSGKIPAFVPEIKRLFNLLLQTMSKTETRLYKYIVQLFVLGLFAVATLSRCANPMAPQGGPRDTLAPKVITMTPTFGTTNFKDKKIYIEFNEYVELKEQQKELYTSPFMEKKPLVTLKNKGIQIELKDSLLPDRTYSINFGRSVVDVNEGNPYTGLRYVFSTGNQIDSLLMSGYTVDAATTDTLGNVFILFFDPALDSIPVYDSTVINHKPLVVGRSMPNGIFMAENLKGIPYRVYALEDKNGNMSYEPGVDRIAFMDSTYNPLHLPEFDMWYDTIRYYMQADPQLQLDLFMDQPFKRQTYTSSNRPQANKVQIYFTAPFPNIKQLQFEGIDSSKIMTEYLTERHDSIALWFTIPEAEMPDTLKGKLIYERHDSLNKLYWHTQDLKLGWRTLPQKEKSKKEKKEEEKEPNPFKVSVDASATINPEKNIRFTFIYPLTKVDSNAIELVKIGEGDLQTPTKVQFRQDSLKIREWVLSAPWKADEKFKLVIPPGTFVNSNGESNDSLKAEFSIESPDKFATIILNVKGKTPESEYIVQIIGKGNKILKEVPHIKTGKHTFYYIEAGTVRIRVIEDLNANGKWDTGSLIGRRQPERVEMLLGDDNSEELVTKVKWDRELNDIDMAKVFGPVTQQQIIEKIQRREVIQMRERAKKLEENAKNKKDNHQNSSNSNSSGMGNFGGMGGGTFRQ